MENLRRKAEKATGEHIGNDSLIRVNVHKTDLRLDGITFTPKSFLFDTSIFAYETSGMGPTSLDGEVITELDANYYFRSDKSSNNCYGLGPFGILQDDSVSARVDLNDLHDMAGTAEVITYNIGTYNYSLFTEGATVLPNVGVTQRKYTLSQFASSAGSELGYSVALNAEEIEGLWYNHIISNTLKDYLNMALGVDVTETGFYFNQDQVGFDETRGTIEFNRQSFKNDSGEDFYSTSEWMSAAGPYQADANYVETIYNTYLNDSGGGGFIELSSFAGDTPIPDPIRERLASLHKNTTLFGHEAYYRRLTLPRVFERTFSMLIDIENDFDVANTSGRFDSGDGSMGIGLGETSGPDTLTQRGSEMYAFHITVDLIKTDTRSLRTSESLSDLITETNWMV